MSILFWMFAVALGGTCFAQSTSIGAIGGVRATSDVNRTSANGLSVASKFYVIGPFVDGGFASRVAYGSVNVVEYFGLHGVVGGQHDVNWQSLGGIIGGGV